MSFIDYKGTADWLLAGILKWIADRLILYPNHPSIDRAKLLECFQEYEGCLSAAKIAFIEETAPDKMTSSIGFAEKFLLVFGTLAVAFVGELGKGNACVS